MAMQTKSLKPDDTPHACELALKTQDYYHLNELFANDTITPDQFDQLMALHTSPDDEHYNIQLDDAINALDNDIQPTQPTYTTTEVNNIENETHTPGIHESESTSQSSAYMDMIDTENNDSNDFAALSDTEYPLHINTLAIEPTQFSDISDAPPTITNNDISSISIQKHSIDSDTTSSSSAFSVSPTLSVTPIPPKPPIPQPPGRTESPPQSPVVIPNQPTSSPPQSPIQQQPVAHSTQQSQCPRRTNTQ